jgi:ATP-dependent Clp protease protease subunit
MIHQPIGGFRGQATDIEIHAKETLNIKSIINGIYTKHTGQKLSTIEKSMERDNFMNPEQAKEFGLVDSIVSSKELMLVQK